MLHQYEEPVIVYHQEIQKAESLEVQAIDYNPSLQAIDLSFFEHPFLHRLSGSFRCLPEATTISTIFDGKPFWKDFKLSAGLTFVNQYENVYVGSQFLFMPQTNKRGEIFLLPTKADISLLLQEVPLIRNILFTADLVHRNLLIQNCGWKYISQALFSYTISCSIYDDFFSKPTDISKEIEEELGINISRRIHKAMAFLHASLNVSDTFKIPFNLPLSKNVLIRGVNLEIPVCLLGNNNKDKENAALELNAYSGLRHALNLHERQALIYPQFFFYTTTTNMYEKYQGSIFTFKESLGEMPHEFHRPFDLLVGIGWDIFSLERTELFNGSYIVSLKSPKVIQGKIMFLLPLNITVVISSGVNLKQLSVNQPDIQVFVMPRPMFFLIT